MSLVHQKISLSTPKTFFTNPYEVALQTSKYKNRAVSLVGMSLSATYETAVLITQNPTKF